MNQQQPYVLVVDDDASLLRMLRIALESNDLTVATARNGLAALDLLEQRAAHPNLVLLDMQMPEMDGRAFFKEFRERGYTSPVIVISAYDAQTACEDLGAQGSISKPLDPIQLASRVREIIDQSQD